MTEPLVLNNGQAPVPAATSTIVLREFSGVPIPQPDEDQNFINIVDRINSMPVLEYDATTRTLNITQS